MMAAKYVNGSSRGRSQAADQDLSQAKAKLEQTLASITDGYYALDDKWRFIALNPMAEQHFGLPANKLIGRNIWQLTDTSTDSEIFQQFHLALEKGRPHHFEAKSRIRTNYWAEMHLYPRNGMLEVYYRDISPRKQAEASLQESEERFRKVFENAPMGIAITDWTGRFLMCNPAYCTLVGYTEGELQRLAFDDLIHPEDRDANLLAINHLKSGERPNIQLKNRYVHKNGREIWVHKVMSVLPNIKSEPGNLLTLVRDITESIQDKELLAMLNRALSERSDLAEQRAVYIQKLAMELSKAEERERQRLAGILHDDLQQLLAYLKIKLTTQSAVPGGLADISMFTDLIDQCIERCRNMAHELKPFSMQNIDFLSALQSLCGRMKTMYGLEVALQSNTAPKIESSVLSSLLIRSIRELLFNVVKHSETSHATVEVWVNGRQLLITVTDQGRGCDSTDLYEKRNAQEAFGLFDIEDRINFLGGNMQVESKPGQGFCARLWVPSDVGSLSDGRVRPSDIPDNWAFELKKTAPAASHSSFKGCVRVILADDHQILRDGLIELLESEEDITVIGTASDGRKAVHLAEVLKPDVILMDVSMPVMNGIAATQRIREFLPNICIIGLTMYEDPAIQKAMLNAGACVCLCKTDAPGKLITHIRSDHRTPVSAS
jgi:PAS domain S-box-containing protein